MVHLVRTVAVVDSSPTLCPRCGAPVPPPSVVRSQRCPYCRVALSPTSGVWRPQLADDDAFGDLREPRFWLGGHRYALIGRLARGASCDVFLARRDEAMTARVVVKIPRSKAADDALAHEDDVLASLAASTAQGAPHFTRLMPERVVLGRARLGANGNDGERLLAIRRWRPGFVHTLEDVRRAHARLDPAHGVWIWKRVLESLGFVHASGWAHGAITAAHLLVNARDHGVVLAGFSHAARPGHDASLRADVVATARAMQSVVGDRAPEPLAKLLASPPDASAWELVETVSRVARDVFGPPRFVPLAMP